MTQDELTQENKETVEKFFRLCNYMGNENDLAKLVVEHMRREHRTIIQNFFRLVAAVIKEYAKTEQFDARNEDSVKWAKEVSKIESYMGHI